MVDLCSLRIAMTVLACKDSQVAPLNSRQVFHHGLIRGTCGVCMNMDAHHVCVSAICQEGSSHLFPELSCSSQLCSSAVIQRVKRGSGYYRSRTAWIWGFGPQKQSLWCEVNMTEKSWVATDLFMQCSSSEFNKRSEPQTWVGLSRAFNAFKQQITPGVWWLFFERK